MRKRLVFFFQVGLKNVYILPCASVYFRFPPNLWNTLFILVILYLAARSLAQENFSDM